MQVQYAISVLNIRIQKHLMIREIAIAYRFLVSWDICLNEILNGSFDVGLIQCFTIFCDSTKIKTSKNFNPQEEQIILIKTHLNQGNNFINANKCPQPQLRIVYLVFFVENLK